MAHAIASRTHLGTTHRGYLSGACLRSPTTCVAASVTAKGTTSKGVPFLLIWTRRRRYITILLRSNRCALMSDPSIKEVGGAIPQKKRVFRDGRHRSGETIRVVILIPVKLGLPSLLRNIATFGLDDSHQGAGGEPLLGYLRCLLPSGRGRWVQGDMRRTMFRQEFHVLLEKLRLILGDARLA